VAAAILAALQAAQAHAQVTDAQIAACVRDNLAKYAPPDRAVAVQYLSIESACQALLEGGSGAQIAVTPLPGGDGGAGSGGGSEPVATGGGGAGAGAATGSPAAPAAGTDRGGDTTGGGEPAALPGAAAAVTPAALPLVRAALREADTRGPASPFAVTSAPAWILVLVVLGVLAALAGVAIEVRRRLR